MRPLTFPKDSVLHARPLTHIIALMLRFVQDLHVCHAMNDGPLPAQR